MQRMQRRGKQVVQLRDGIGASGCCFVKISAKQEREPGDPVVEILLQRLHEPACCRKHWCNPGYAAVTGMNCICDDGLNDLRGLPATTRFEIAAASIRL